MANPIERGIGRFAAGLVDLSRRNAVAVLFATLATTLGCLGYAALTLEVNPDHGAMFSEDLDFRKLDRQLEAAFPILKNNLLIVVDGDSPARARDAAEAIGARLRAREDEFGSVYLPAAGPFLDRYGLLYLDVDELGDLADRLAEAQPFLAEISRDPTLAGLASVMTRALDSARSGDLPSVELGPILAALDRSFEGLLAGRESPFSWEEWVLGPEAVATARRQLVIVQPRVDLESLTPGSAAIDAVHRIARELGLDREHGVRVRVTGDLALATEEMELVSRQAALAMGASFVMVGIVLFAALRSGTLLLATLVTLVVGLSWTAGFAAFAVGHLNLISVAFAVLFIGLGVDFGIHFGLRYRELLGLGRESAAALFETGQSVGSSLVLCAGTTAIGFFSFIPTAYAGVAELGVISGTGMFLSLLATLTVLPAMISLGRVPPPDPGPDLRAAAGAGAGARVGRPNAGRSPRVRNLVLLAAAVSAGVPLFWLDRVHFDADPTGVRDPGAESVQAFRDLLADSDTSPWPIELLAPDLESADREVPRLEAIPQVDRVLSLLSFVPDDQEEKLEILGDVLLFLGPIGVPPKQLAIDSSRTLRELSRWRAALVAYAQAEPSPEAEQLGRTLGALLERLSSAPLVTEEIARLQAGSLGNLPRWIERLEEALQAREFSLEDLPEPLVDRYLASDGQARIEVYAAEDLSEAERLPGFVDAVRAVAPGATGAAVSIVESARAVVLALLQALTGGFVAIFILLFALWRRLRDTLLALVPLAHTAILTLGAMVAIGLPFNFADVIVLPLLLGIGIDSGIHLIHRHRRVESHDRGLLHTSTARAVFYSALTTIASFGTLGLSTHRGMASLGQLLTLGLCLTLISNLGVLPALLDWLEPRGVEGEGSRAGAG